MDIDKRFGREGLRGTNGIQMVREPFPHISVGDEYINKLFRVEIVSAKLLSAFRRRHLLQDDGTGCVREKALDFARAFTFLVKPRCVLLDFPPPIIFDERQDVFGHTVVKLYYHRLGGSTDDVFLGHVEIRFIGIVVLKKVGI